MVEISVKGLHKYYGANHILKGLSFEIYKGENVGLLGKNGAGKTTLFKILAGIENYEEGSVNIAADSIVGVLDQIPEYPASYTVTDVLKTAFDRIFQLKAEMRELEKKLELNPDPADVKRYGAIQTEFEASGGYTIDSSIAKVCNGLGISEDMQKKPFSLLSGGEKTRVNLARIILQNTDILLLDEPTNHLDIHSVEWLEEYIGQYKGTVVVISHDRYFLDKVINRAIEIEDGKADFYDGNYSYYIQEKERRYEQKLAQYEQEQKKIKQLEEAARRMHEWAKSADNPGLHKRAFAIEKRIEKMEKIEKPRKEKQISVAFQGKGFAGNDVIVIKNLSKSYGEEWILSNVNLNVKKDDRIALIGDNGCGKTTLLKIITGEVEADTGIVKIGNSVKYAFLPQIVTFSYPEYSVLDTMKHEMEMSEEMARNRLAAFHFRGEEVFKQVGSLSGGEKSRLRLCILMQNDINLLILDEPTNHLDIASREWIEEAVAGFEGTILFVSHDRYFINKFANRIWELKDGSITDYYGDYASYSKWKTKNDEVSKVPASKKKDNSLNEYYKKKKEKEALKKEKEYEKRIMQLEERVNAIENEMEQASSDYERLNSLFAEKEELLREIDRLYEEWESCVL